MDKGGQQKVGGGRLDDAVDIGMCGVASILVVRYVRWQVDLSWHASFAATPSVSREGASDPHTRRVVPGEKEKKKKEKRRKKKTRQSQRDILLSSSRAVPWTGHVGVHGTDCHSGGTRETDKARLRGKSYGFGRFLHSFSRPFSCIFLERHRAC